MNQLLKGEPMTIFGDGSQKRAFTHIDDVAPIIANSVNVPEARNQVFNVGADLPYSINELAQVVAQAMGTECRVKYLPARKEVKVAFSDHSKCDVVFGPRKKIDLQEGISRMAKWVKKHGARESGIFKDIEVMSNMPKSWADVIERRERK
jgi:UDP-glucose 4-epimerase